MINESEPTLTNGNDNTSKIHYGMCVVLENALVKRLKAKREIYVTSARATRLERRPNVGAGAIATQN